MGYLSLSKSQFQNLGKNFVVAVSYILTARLGLLIALAPGFATTFWPPSGIAVAALLLLGYRAWPGIFIGSAITNYLTSSHAPIMASFPAILGIAAGSTFQALLISYFLSRFAEGANFFKSHKHVFNFFMLTFAGCLVAATFGVFSLYIGNVITLSQFGQNWLTWWLGDSVGIFVFCPLVLTWVLTFDWGEFKHRFFEFFQILTVIALIGCISFWNYFGKSFPLEYLFLPCIVWAAFRLEPYASCSLILIISCISIWGTAHGFGPFAENNLNHSWLLLEAFIGVLSATSLTMIAIVHELERFYRQLEDRNSKMNEAIEGHFSEMERIKAQIANFTAHSDFRPEESAPFVEPGELQKNYTPVNLNGLVTGIANLITLDRKATFNASIEKLLDPSISHVTIIPLDFSVAFAILLNQAYDSVINKKPLESNAIYAPLIRIETHDLGEFIEIIIRDNGQGMSESMQDILKKAGASGEKNRMSICYDIIKKQGGELSIESIAGQYAEFSVTLPKNPLSP